MPTANTSYENIKLKMQNSTTNTVRGGYNSLSAKVSYSNNLIQNHSGWEYVGVYADEAKTGTKDSREDFQRLLADCRAGKVDMVIRKHIFSFVALS